MFAVSQRKGFVIALYLTQANLAVELKIYLVWLDYIAAHLIELSLQLLYFFSHFIELIQYDPYFSIFMLFVLGIRP